MSEYIDKKAVLDMVNTLQYKDVLYPDAAVYNHAIDEVRNLIAVFPTSDVGEVPRWIPVTERLPEESGDYILYRPHFWGANNGQVTVCYWNTHDWSDNYKNDAERYLPMIDGMAWMPLPEPYKEIEDE